MKSSLSMELGSDDEGRRLDRVLRKALTDLPLSAIHRALRKGDIRVDGKKRSPEYRCRLGERIECRIHVAETAGDAPLHKQAGPIRPPDRPSPAIIHEDEDLLFVNKPRGQLVHGAADSLEADVRGYLTGKLPPSISFLPGPLHRLDRNSSGLLCFSKSLEGAVRFSAAIRYGKIRKTYLALTEGSFEGTRHWEDRLIRGADMRSRALSADAAEEYEGKSKVASLEILGLKGGGELGLALIRLHSGRTHQIRVQSAFHGFPLAGDVKYGASRRNFPYLLHAFRLSFDQELYKGLPLSLEAPIPEYFLEFIEKYFSLPPEDVYSLIRQSHFSGG
jgi:23S rRNA pseudouridine955/2504/2580 synthase